MTLACFLLLCNVGLTLGAPGITDIEKDTHQQILQEALQHNRSGVSSTWTSENGNWGAITPSITFVDNYHRDCRKFNNSLQINNNLVLNSATACRNKAGFWKIL